MNKAFGTGLAADKADLTTREIAKLVDHAGASARVTLLARLMARATRSKTGCLIWTGGRSDHGYGRIRINSHTVSVHCVMYVLVKGPIPPGHQIDHVCHNLDLTCGDGNMCGHRSCMEPDHLDAVTPSENVRRAKRGMVVRRTHCAQQHEFTAANTYLHEGKRYCRKCRRDRVREHLERASTTNRGACPVCGRSTRIRMDGTIRWHAGEADVGQEKVTICRGVGLKPKES